MGTYQPVWVEFFIWSWSLLRLCYGFDASGMDMMEYVNVHLLCFYNMHTESHKSCTGTEITGNRHVFASDRFVIQISRNLDAVPNSQRKRLMPGKVSPRRPVPDHIPRPPYVNSRQPAGIASGPEVHDERGIECMRASGRLAAQVLEYAGTLVKVT